MSGGSLEEQLADGPLPLDHIQAILNQVGSALTAAHRRAIVHRDLKPANILLDEEGNAYLSDFGIAKELEGGTDLTMTGALMGTPAYMTPEQAQSGAISPQTDIYAFGILLFEMLSGAHPFPDTPLGDLIVKHLYEPLPNLEDAQPNLPIGLDDVIQRATAKDPIDRYPDVATLLENFNQVLAAQKLTAPAVSKTTLTSPNPYKGLRAFQEADVLDFYGREALVDRLVERIQEPGPYSRFLAIVGASGSGKSSVLRAGLLPALRGGAVEGSQDWFIVSLLPGQHPLSELAQALEKISVERRAGYESILQKDHEGLALAARIALPSDDARLLLVIDQFEELFTLTTNLEERDLFLNSLAFAVTAADSQVQSIITLRADFYDQPLMHARLGDLFEERTQIVRPMKAHELTRVIRSPIERVGGVFEVGMVAEITAQVSENPGTLPLLQYALTELYERRDGNTLTRAAYQDIGGVLGALGKRAEQIYQGLSLPEQTAARQIFLRLVTLGEGAEDTRRRVPRNELEALAGSPTALDSVLEPFGAARLLAFDRDAATRSATVELAHEALIREWQRLKAWLEQGRSDVRMQRRLAGAAAEWLTHEQDNGFLLHDSRLDQFEIWTAESTVELASAEQKFYEASLRQRTRLENEEMARAARLQRLRENARTRLRLLVGVMVLATTIAIFLTSFALSQRSDARSNASTATFAQGLAELEASTAIAAQEEAQRQAALAATSEAAAQANARAALQEAQIALANELATAAKALSPVSAEPELALLLAIHSAETSLMATEHMSVSSEDALRTALRAALPRPLFSLENGGYRAGAINSSGTLLAVSGEHAERPPGWVALIDMSPGRLGEEVALLEEHSSLVRALDFSPDGGQLASGSSDGTVRIWDLTSHQTIQSLPHGGEVIDLKFGGIEDRLIAAGSDGIARSWDLETGQVAVFFRGHSRPIVGLDVSPDGSLLATVSEDRSLRLWDTSTGTQIGVFSVHADTVRDVFFSSDGTLLATVSVDGFTILWDVNKRQQVNKICCLFGVGQGFSQASPTGFAGSFAPGLEYLITAGLSRNFTIWTDFMESAARQTVPIRPGGRVRTVNATFFSPDGLKLILASAGNISSQGSQNARLDGELSIWDFSFGREIAPISFFGRGISNLAFDPDSDRLVSVDGKGLVTIWLLSSGPGGIQKEQVLPADAHRGSVTAVAFHPMAEQLATAGSDRFVRLWNVSGEEPLLLESLRGHTLEISAIDFHPEGTHLASASADRTVAIWDLQALQDPLILRGHAAAVTDVKYNPDGTRIGTASADGTVRIWDGLSGASQQILRGHEAGTNSISFNSDGTKIVSTSDDHTAIVWAIDTGEMLLTLTGHKNPVTSAVFTLDGKRVITSSEDGTSKVWDAQNGNELFSLLGHEGPVVDLALSPDGLLLATASADETLNFYMLDPLALLEYARSLTLRELTEIECQRYLHQAVCPTGSGD